jgi:hypothetical protein
MIRLRRLLHFVGSEIHLVRRPITFAPYHQNDALLQPREQHAGLPLTYRPVPDIA